MVTGAELIALAANYEGKHTQAFPFFGSEKRGPPVEAYVRIDEKAISIHEEIAEPGIVIVADSSIMDSVDVCAGLQAEGILIINSTKKPGHFKDLKAKRIFTVDATEIALKYFGRMILNTVMLGAFCKVTDVVALDSIKRAATEKFSKKFPQKIIDANIKAIEEVYNKMEVQKIEVKK